MSESKTPIEPIETLVERDLSGWAKFIWNCADGSNYFRYSEYCDLIWTLDRYASDLAVALAERDAAKAELKSLLEEPFFRGHQHALHRAMVAEAERDALAARVAEAEKERDEWAAKWQTVRRELAELKYPGMTGVVRANDAALFREPQS